MMAGQDDIISRLLAARSGAAVSPAITAATKQGLSRTDLSALLSPSMLVGTGVVDTSALGTGLQNYYNKLIEDELARFTQETAAAEAAAGAAPVRPRPPQPSATASNIVNKWQTWTSNNYSPIAGGVADLLNQAGMGASGSEAVDSWFAGLDANAQAVMGTKLGELKADLDTVQKEGIDFSVRNRIYQEDLADFEDKQATYEATLEAKRGTVAPVSDPDMAAAWAQYAKDIGVPGLGALPSPMETYQFTPEDVRAVRKPTQRGTTMNLLESMLQRRGQARPQGRPTGLPPAQAAPDVLRSGQGPRSAITASEQKAAEASALRTAMERRAAMDPLDIMAAGYRMMDQSKARSLGRQAAAQGRTPLQDVLDEMIRYGVLEASQ